MPCARKHHGLALGANRPEEIDWLVVGVGEPERHYHVTYPDVERRDDKSREVKLLECHFAAFFDFGLILAVFAVFYLVGDTGAARFKFNLGAEYPFGCKLIVKCKYKPRYCHCVATLLGDTVFLKLVDAVVLERRYHLAVTAKPEF